MEQEIISECYWFVFLPVKVVQWEAVGNHWNESLAVLKTRLTLLPVFAYISFNGVERETQMKKTTPLKFF